MPMRPALALFLLLATTTPAPAGDAEKRVIGNNPIQKLIQTRQPVFIGPSPSGLPAWNPTPADPPLSADEHIRNGLTLTGEQCAELTAAVWLRVRERDFCIRYWLSTVGGRKQEALVYLHGDIGGLIDGKLQLVDAARAVTATSAERDADASSRTYRGPYVAIGRPGALGSSGHHVNDRRTWLEFQVIDAALDAIKARHGFSRLHLVGHSGGGHSVAALARRRDDVGCAVMASAALSLATWHRLKGQSYSQAVRPLYDPIDHVVLMQPRAGLRLIVLSDPDDKVVPFAVQREFVERVQAHGLAVLHITAAARDALSHNLAGPAIRLATDCAGGGDDHTLLARYWTKPVAAPVAAKPTGDRPATAGCSSFSLIGPRPLSHCTPEWPPAAAPVRGDRLPLPASRVPNVSETSVAPARGDHPRPPAPATPASPPALSGN
jgi:pimeloyl-ACP methyl ester carboxylesterase